MTVALAAAPASVIAADFVPPHLDYAALLPMFVVFGASLIGILVEAFVGRRSRPMIQFWLTVAALVIALVLTVRLAVEDTAVQTAGSGTSGSVTIDQVALFLQGTLLALAVLATLLMSENSAGEAGSAFTPQGSAVPGSAAEAAALRSGLVQTEIYPLMLFSVGGMMLFVAANDLLTMFVALEVFSLPLYLLCGLARRRRLLSQEAALKYFLLGAFASAFFLFGSALLYGFAGSISFGAINNAITAADGVAVVGRDGLLLMGSAMVGVGLLFKVGAAPFHLWTPDVYQGAPTPVTAFMAACTKVAAFGALLRVAYVALPGIAWDWRPALFGVAVLTMVVGSVIAVVQTDVKRMLAYSSIAHAGFILTGLAALDKSGISGVLFYLFAYGFTTIGAFALVSLVRDTTDEGIGGEASHLSQWAGLGKRHPVTAAAFTLFLLAMAGIPLTSGFMGKYAVFSAAVANGAWVLALIGVLASAVAAFFYVRVIVLMYFSEPTSGPGTVVATPGYGTLFTILFTVAITVVLGVAPSVLFSPAEASAIFLR